MDEGLPEEHPNFATAINQLHGSPDSLATRAASVGFMQELRAIFQQYMELVLQGAMSVDVALTEMATEGNAAIESYAANL